MDARVKEIEARLKEAVDPEYSGRESIALRASVADIPYLLTALREVLEREKSQRWIPVSERLPEIEDGLESSKTVNVYCPAMRNIYAAHWCKRGAWLIAGAYQELREAVTLWMPLPAPPAKEESNEHK